MSPSPFDPEPPPRPNPIATTLQIFNTALFAAITGGLAYIEMPIEVIGFFGLITAAYAYAVYKRMRRHLADPPTFDPPA